MKTRIAVGALLGSFVVHVALVVSCGDDPFLAPSPDADAAPAPEPEPGRLKRVVRVVEDGQKEPLGWHDSKRGVDCAWERADDGETRCLPSVYAFASDYYADSACTVNVAIKPGLRDGCAVPTVVKLPVQVDGGSLCTGSPTAWTVYELGPRLDATAPLFVRDPSGCRGATPAEGVAYFAIGELVPATEFVASSLRVE